MKKHQKTIPVFILTLKNSSREINLKKRLDLLKIDYKIFYAISGKEKKKWKRQVNRTWEGEVLRV